jgi:hypothetical protein
MDGTSFGTERRSRRPILVPLVRPVTIDWHIDPERGVVHLRYGGTPEFSVWSETMRAIFAHPEYRVGFGFVADIGGCEPPDTSYVVQNIQFVAEHAAQIGSARWANVTTDPAHYGMTRIAQARSHDLPSQVDVFRTMEEAIAWASPKSAGEL